MINSIARTPETALFNHLTNNSQIIREGIQNLRNIGLTQRDIVLRTIAMHSKSGNKEFIEASGRINSFHKKLALLKNLVYSDSRLTLFLRTAGKRFHMGEQEKAWQSIWLSWSHRQR